LFLAQQIGKKALKAFLYAKGEEVIIGHLIERLCNYELKFKLEFFKKLKKMVYT